jgi:hypothetical protein
MRERIEHGEQADLSASADIGRARTLVEQGRATITAKFARNSICALAPRRAWSYGKGGSRHGIRPHVAAFLVERRSSHAEPQQHLPDDR